MSKLILVPFHTAYIVMHISPLKMRNFSDICLSIIHSLYSALERLE